MKVLYDAAKHRKLPGNLGASYFAGAVNRVTTAIYLRRCATPGSGELADLLFASRATAAKHARDLGQPFQRGGPEHSTHIPAVDTFIARSQL